MCDLLVFALFFLHSFKENRNNIRSYALHNLYTCTLFETILLPISLGESTLARRHHAKSIGRMKRVRFGWCEVSHWIDVLFCSAKVLSKDHECSMANS
jgi:hypothetical protein